MSQVPPLTHEQRLANYRAQTPNGRLTPAQERRLRHKGNETFREFPSRPGRLRRRFDRKDNREVKSMARRVVAFVRQRRGF